MAFVRFALPAQPVDATQALNLSAGFSNPRVLRGRSFMDRHIYLNEARFYKETEELGAGRSILSLRNQLQETNMASPAEDRMAGSTGSDAEVAAGRAARDDLAGDVNKLRKDVAVIRNTVAEIARIVASQAGEPPAHPRSDIASTLKEKFVITMVFGLLGAILLLLSVIFGIEALHEWLKSHYGSLPAFIILCSAWAVLGVVFLYIALLLSKRVRRASRGGEANVQLPGADETK